MPVPVPVPVLLGGPELAAGAEEEAGDGAEGGVEDEAVNAHQYLSTIAFMIICTEYLPADGPSAMPLVEEPAAGPLLFGLPKPWPPATGCQAGVASPGAQSLIGGEVVLSRWGL